MHFCVLLNLLNVVDGQANEQVHDHDAHHEDKDDEQNIRVVLERRRVLSSIMRKECLIFELAHHHHKGLDQGPGRVGKEWLNGECIPNGVF